MTTAWPVNGIVDEVLKLLDTRLETQRITVLRCCPPELIVSADRDQIKQVLLNLCHNSLDAMAAGGELRISAGEAARAGHAGRFFDLSATGSGITMHDLNQQYSSYFP